MWAIKNPDGTIDQRFVGETQRHVWFEHGWYLMAGLYGEEWEKKFWKKERASINDFKKKGYSFIEVEVIEVKKAKREQTYAEFLKKWYKKELCDPPNKVVWIAAQRALLKGC